MSSAAPSSRWRFVLAPRWLAWHAFTVAAVVGMLWLGDWQFRRAEHGNALSWAYTFEWPVFAVFGLVFWAKTILDEARPAKASGAAAAEPGAGPAGGPGLPVPAGRRGGADDGGDPGDPGDPELDQYNAYLGRLSQQAADRGRGRQRR
jgi:hypothetical protein